MALVGGIGAGLLILIVLWILTIIASLTLVFIPKARYAIPLVVLVSILVTVVLLVIPRGPSGVGLPPEDIDTIYFGRVVLLVVMVISVLVGLVGVVIYHVLPERLAGPIKSQWSHMTL